MNVRKPHISKIEPNPFGLYPADGINILGSNFDQGASVIIVKDDSGKRFDINSIDYKSDTHINVIFGGLLIDEDVPAHVQVTNYDGWADTAQFSFLE